ncbi:MAG: isocitrate lyase/phosphoenolpyruvate mutase family protein [Salinibacterium sp.]|nr:isocitrate lyase/phosphoenolpyruvate mutase family protein [Salinibacterium sp.]
MTTQQDKAVLLDSLHVPGEPLIVTNVWDAVTARTVAAAAGVRAIATASHAVSFAHGVADGEGLTLDEALAAARRIVSSVELPVSVDFERGYATDAANLQRNVEALIATGAVGLNLEDSASATELFPRELAVARVAAVRRAAASTGIPIVLNARVDALVRGSNRDDAADRANAYLEAGADVIFMLGARDEESISWVIEAVNGRVSVIANPSSPPLTTLAELGVSRVSFGPGTLGLTLAHLQAAAAQLTVLGDYPTELGFSY